MSYTKFPNHLIDLMPSLSGNDWRVLTAIIRQTIGYQKEKDRISLRQFERLTGIKGRQHIKASIDKLIEVEAIAREKEGQYFYYKVVTNSYHLSGNKSLPLNGQVVTNSYQGGNKSLPQVVTNSYQQKKKETNQNNNNTNEDINPLYHPLRTALLGTVAENGTYVFDTDVQEKINSATEILYGWEATVAQVDQFFEWWQKNGHYGGKPWLKSLMSHWERYSSETQKSNCVIEHVEPLD